MKFCTKVWEKTDKGLLAAFGIPTLLVLVLYIINGVYPFGNRNFMFMDMYHQYVPFFEEFMEKISAGEGLSYSWNVGVGSNFLALYVYYLASPLHWLAFLFPREIMIEFLGYLVMIKIGLCGLTACYYLQKHFRTKSPVVVLISCFYAFSGFMAAYNWNIMWLDCVILFPLIMLGLEALVKEGKWILYTVTLGLSIFTNYYLSIMICIFLVLYFAVLFLTEKKGFRAIRDFAMFSLLAGGMAAVLLIPEVCAILATDFGDVNFPEKWKSYFSLLDVLARHCMLVPTERGLDHWPNIFCGTAALFMVPLYASNPGIPAKRKLGYLALAGILLLSFSVNILDFIWHGLNYPDSLPARQSYIYIFLVIIMCTDAFLHIKDVAKEKILYSYLIAVAFLLFCEKFPPEDGEAFTPLIMLMTLLFMTLYAAVVYCYRTHEEHAYQKILFFVLAMLVVLENGIHTINTSMGTVSRSAYVEHLTDYETLYQQVKEENDGFYRVEKFTRKTKNDGTLVGYPTASVFSSTLNSSVADIYEELGMRHSKVYYGYDGATPFTSALLNVQYMFGMTEDEAMNESNTDEDRLYTAVGSSGEITIYESNYSIPFGYVVPESFEVPKNGDNAIDRQNKMVEELGVDGKLFVRASSTQNGDNVEMTVKEDGYYYMLVTSAGNTDIWASTSYGVKKFNDLKRGCIIYAGYFEEGDYVEFANGDEEDASQKIRLNAFRLNMDVLQQAIEILGQTHLENVEYDSTHISGTINMTQAGKLLLSVPYEKGWTVRVDGKEVETGLFGECFMTISLEAGEHEITMDYVPYGKYAGIAVSVISILCFACCLWKRRMWKAYGGSRQTCPEEEIAAEEE